MMMPRSRAGIIIVAFLIACVVAAAVIVVTLRVIQPTADEPTFREFFGSLLILGTYIFFMAMLPASIAIVYAESANVRAAKFYLFAGAVAGSLPPLIAGFSAIASGQYKAYFVLISLLGVAGACGGVAYWALAGRNAGTDKASMQADIQREKQ